MRTLLSLLAVASAMSLAPPAGGATAYEALKVVQKSRGDAALKQFVEVRGETGQPQPQGWTILMSDPSARGGVREIVVVGREIASERTPLRGSSVAGRPALNFALLNLDSDGAFRVANQQALARKVGFHTVDYTLRTGEENGAPVWVLNLFDYMGAPVGTLRVSAETGKVVSSLRLDPDARQKPLAEVGSTPFPTRIAPDEDEEQETGSAEAGDEATYFRGGVFGFVERSVRRVGTGVRNTTLGVAGTVQEVLTGERTVDQNRDQPEE